MPRCSACNSDMVIHDDGFSSKVWKCTHDSNHPSTTTQGDGATAIMIGGAALTVAGIIGAIPSGGTTAPLIVKGLAMMAGGAAGGSNLG